MEAEAGRSWRLGYLAPHLCCSVAIALLGKLLSRRAHLMHELAPAPHADLADDLRSERLWMCPPAVGLHRALGCCSDVVLRFLRLGCTAQAAEGAASSYSGLLLGAFGGLMASLPHQSPMPTALACCIRGPAVTRGALTCSWIV